MKERARKKHKRINTQTTLQNYQALRKESKKLIKLAYCMHTTRVENEINENPRAFWKFINSKRNDSSHSVHFTYNNEEKTGDQNIAEAFATYFQSVFANSLNYAYADDVVDSAHTQIISLREITIDDVDAALKRMKPKRAIGPDGIPQYIYKACSELLTAPLTHIFNLVIKTSKLPHAWEVSAVTPIHKVANPNNITDYRPINNMPVPKKVFEKVLYMNIYPQIHNLIAKEQHGFVRGRTIETNLLEFTYYTSKILDNSPPSAIGCDLYRLPESVR